ncbi:leucine-rich repeat protein [Phocaeicola plebeius]|uniref:leucine-rich repeat protein n=1 Tax=Phocaeicola TaxID=909656 RepID=UPI0015F32373
MASVAFPASLKEIGGHAFEDCVALTEVDLSKTALQEISSDAFRVFITIEQPKLIRNIRV